MIERREILARWVLKTASILNYATNYRRIVPQNHFESVFGATFPGGLYIALGFTYGLEPPLTWRQSQTFLFNTIANESSMVKEKTEEFTSRGNGPYKISFQFKHLLLKVCYMPFSNFEPYDKTISAFELWPYVRMPDNFGLCRDIDDFDVEGFYIQTEQFGQNETEYTQSEPRSAGRG